MHDDDSWFVYIRTEGSRLPMLKIYKSPLAFTAVATNLWKRRVFLVLVALCMLDGRLPMQLSTAQQDCRYYLQETIRSKEWQQILGQHVWLIHRELIHCTLTGIVGSTDGLLQEPTWMMQKIRRNSRVCTRRRSSFSKRRSEWIDMIVQWEILSVTTEYIDYLFSPTFHIHASPERSRYELMIYHGCQ
jgi:hypothetical protein